MCHQLKRVSVSKFYGDKRSYEGWKAAFMTCIDQVNASAEYKLLQLRECLGGEALDSIKNLGHSREAYEAAKKKLERKFGGQRRQISLFLEDLENHRPVYKIFHCRKIFYLVFFHFFPYLIFFH